MNTARKARNQPSHFTDAFTDYSPDIFDCVPLNKPNARKEIVRKGQTIVVPIGKAPTDSKWTSKTYDSARVQDRCQRQRRNMGIRPTEEQLILDIDPRHGGGDSWEMFKLHLGDSFDENDFPIVETGGGGSHVYMTKPADLELESMLDGYPGIEIKTSKHQVLAAGCQHPDTGRLYSHRKGSAPLNELKPAPAALLKLAKRKPRPKSSGGGHVSPERLEKALAALDARTLNHNDRWLPILMACHHATGGSDEGRAVFIEWCITDEDYAHDQERIGARWDSLTPDIEGGRTVATLNDALVKAGHSSLCLPVESARDRFDDGLEFLSDDAGTDDDEGGWPREFEGATTALVPYEMPTSLRLNREKVAASEVSNALIAITASGLRPKYNLVSQKVEFHGQTLPKGLERGGELSDNIVLIIRDYLIATYQEYSYNPSSTDIRDAIKMLALRERYNPITDYLNNLKWDGVPRVETLFGHYFKCGDDPYTRAVSRCFMIGAVRRARHPGCKFDEMPVLKGPQGWNKSTAVKILAGADWYTDAAVDIRSKDATMILRGIWIYEFAELEGMRRKEAHEYKSWLGRATDRQRDPFGHIVEDFPRNWIPIGTTNEGGYLKDGTGSRRFWPLTVTEFIDVAAIAADRDQLWAEAAFMESNGESSSLPRELWGVAGKRQSAETSSDPWADTLGQFLIARTSDTVDRMPADRVLAAELYDALEIGTDRRTRELGQRLRSVMESGLGWTYKDKLRVKDYTGSGYFK